MKKKPDPNRAWEYLKLLAVAYGFFALGVLYVADGVEKYRKKKRDEKERRNEKKRSG